MKTTLLLIALAGLALVPGVASADIQPPECLRPLADVKWCPYWPTPSHATLCGSLIEGSWPCPV